MDEAMKEYASNETICRRDLLFRDFEVVGFVVVCLSVCLSTKK